MPWTWASVFIGWFLDEFTHCFMEQHTAERAFTTADDCSLSNWANVFLIVLLFQLCHSFSRRMINHAHMNMPTHRTPNTEIRAEKYQLTRSRMKRKKKKIKQKQIGFSEYVNKNRISEKRRIVFCLPSDQMLFVVNSLGLSSIDSFSASICFLVAKSLTHCVFFSVSLSKSVFMCKNGSAWKPLRLKWLRLKWLHLYEMLSNYSRNRSIVICECFLVFECECETVGNPWNKLLFLKNIKPLRAF